ncbi:hypothetical protein KI387_038031, partial [Taxus chinensis]
MEVTDSTFPFPGRTIVPPLKRTREATPEGEEKEEEGGLDHCKRNNMYYTRRSSSGTRTSEPPKDNTKKEKFKCKGVKAVSSLEAGEESDLEAKGKTLRKEL